MRDLTFNHDNLSEILIFVLILFSHAYFFNTGKWNSESRLAQIHSLVENHTLSIEHSKTGDISIKDGKIYPNKPPGSTLLGVIPYFIIYHVQKIAGLDPKNDLSIILLDEWLINFFSNNILFAIACVFFFRLCIFMKCSKFHSFMLTLSLSLGTMLWPYSSVYMGHVQAASFYILGLYFYLKKTRPFLSGMLLGFSVLTDFFTFFMVIILIIFSFNKKYIQYLLLGALIPMVILFLYNTLTFGGPFELPMKYNNPIFKYDRNDLLFGAFIKPRAIVFNELLFGQYYGLLSFNPILILGLAGILINQNLKITFLILCQVLILVLVNTCFIGWWGGHSIGPRYLIPCIPVLLVSTCSIFEYKILKFLFYIILPLSIYFNLSICATGPVQGKLKSLKYDIIPEFNTGHFAISKCSFNLGNLIGLKGLISLLPLLIIDCILIIINYLIPFK